MAKDCIFCKIQRREIESEVLYRDDSCFVIRDISPKAPLHLLVIPNQHLTYPTDLCHEFYSTLGDMFRIAREMAKREGVVNGGYRLVINQGDDAGQQVPHLHLHVLGGRALGAMG